MAVCILFSNDDIINIAWQFLHGMAWKALKYEHIVNDLFPSCIVWNES